jgi:putative ABC transport system permease protein
MSDVFFAQINVTRGIATDAFMLAVGTTLLASVIPAWKASRMSIVDALRHQR